TVGGKVWFAEYWDNKVGYIDPSEPPDQAVHEFAVSFGGNDMILGPDGNLWWTSASRATGGSIGRISVDGVVQDPLKFSGVDIFRGLVAQNGYVWSGEVDEGRIAKITASGQITEYPTPTSGTAPYGLAADADGNIWFTEPGVSKIGRLTPDHQILEFPTPTSVPNGEANILVAGTGNTIWVGEPGSVNRVAKFDMGQA